MSRLATTLLVLLLPATGGVSLSQTGDVSFEHYTLDDGLSNNVVTSIAQDRFGFIWVATEDGLNRFDGYSFIAYKHDPRTPASIASNIVYSLCSDSLGNLWIGNSVGLDRYDPGIDGFIHYDHASDSTIAIGPGARLLAVERTGSLVIVTLRDAMLRYDPVHNRADTLRPGDVGSPADVITCLYSARDGRLWCSTPSSGLAYCEGGRGGFKNIPVPGGRNNDANPTPVTSIREDGEGNIWYSTFGGGMGRLRLSDLTFVTFRHNARDPGSLGDDAVPSILPDSRGRVWVATFEHGLDRYDPLRNAFDHYPVDPNNPHSVTSPRVYTLFEDRRGSIWAGTWQGGLSVYHPWRRKFTQYSHNPGNPRSLCNDTVWALCEDSKGRLWVGTEGGGIDRYDQSHSRFVHFPHDSRRPASLNSNYAISLLEDHAGRLWIGLYGSGVDRFDEHQGTFVHYRHDPRDPSSPASDRITRIFEDHEHQLWFGSTEGALMRFDPASGKFRTYEIREPLDSVAVKREIEAFAEDRSGNLWIGTFGSGLFRLDPARSVFRSYLRAADGGSLPVPGILSLALDGHGDLWIGTFAGGLFHYNSVNGTFEGFTERDGLPSSYIKGIVPDGRGNLWLSSNKGLTRFAVGSRTFRTYDVTDGVQSSEFRTGSLCRGSGGMICFGGIHGFNMFNPDSMNDNPAPPPIVLTAFRIFDQPVRTGRPIADMQELDLSYAQDYFSFEFVALDYTASKKNRYAYRLEGFDRDWVQCGTRRFASYTHLDGGEYLFRVRGTNNDGVWTAEGASIRIVIHPPFWETWWFRIVLAVLIAGVPFLVYRTRFRRLLAVEQTRTRIARDLHDELSATLSGINFFARAISNDAENSITPNSRRFLSLIHESAGALQDSISDIIWSVNPGQDRWDQIVSKFRRHASDILDSKSISYRFDFPAEVPPGPVAMERRRNVWLIYKEIITNTVKHSKCTHVRISLQFRNDRHADLMIDDDGIGFKPEVESAGNGLRNIRSRAGSAGIQATVRTAPGKGTTWTLRFPV
jgi:ligand-binding sensor domain-containing protein